MAVTKGQKITYADMVDRVVDTIVKTCQNVDGYALTVPDVLRSGYSIPPSTIQVKTTGITKSTGDGKTFHPTVVNAYITYTVNSSQKHLLNTVTRNTIVTQFKEFLNARGIGNQASTIMTTKGILNFAANAAAFIRAKVVVLSSNKTSTQVSFYDQSVNAANVAPSVTAAGNVNNDTFPKDYLSTTMTALNHVDRFQNIVFDVAMPETYNGANNCSSSSSSSSCSSCSSSSSSSSSSSYFIAYMRL